MLRVTGRALLPVVTSLFLAGAVAADDEEARDGVAGPLGPAQLFVEAPDSGGYERLPIARLHVHLDLMPDLALVQIDQSFYNPHPARDEGIVAINLPDGASVCRFATFHGPELVEGKLVERRFFGAIRSSRELEESEPDLFEQVGTNLFRIPVPSIPTRDVKRTLLDYTVPLDCEAGECRFELPLRSDLEPIWDFQLTGALHPPVDDSSMISPTHPALEFVPSPDGGVTFELRREHVQPEPAFTIEYRMPADSGPIVRSFETPDQQNDGQRWQHLAVTIPSDQQAPLDPLPADVLILADTSGSMRDLDLLRSAVRAVVGNLRPQDRFQLGCVDASFRPLTDEWLAAGSDATRSVLADLDQQFPLGASELENTLPPALSRFDEPGEERRQFVIYVGDGVGTESLPGLEWPGVLPTEGPRFAAVQIGTNFKGGGMLREAVRRTGGRLFQTKQHTPQWPELVAWIHAGLSSPRRIESVEIDGVDEVDLFHDPAWLPGCPLHICGRRRPDATVQVTLRLENEPEARRYQLTPVEQSDKDFFTGRTWAERKLESLLARERPYVEVDRGRIVNLSVEWSVMTPHTAFLMRNTQQEIDSWITGSNARQRYWAAPRTLAPLAMPERYRNLAESPPSEPVAPPAPSHPDGERGRYEQGFVDARAALDAGNPDEALRVLARIHTWDEEFDREQFDKLYAETSDALATAKLLESIGPRRGLFDRSALADLTPSQPDLFALSFRPISPEFLKLFPHGQQMIRQISPKAEFMPLNELAAWIHRETGLNVVLDEQNLLDEGISVDEEVNLQGIRRITVRNLLETVLHNVAGVWLDYEFDADVLRITTASIAEERLQTLTYSVADLVATDVPPQPGLLADPFRDIERATQDRVRAKLREPISVDFQGTPLNEVVEYLRDFLDTNVRLDVQNLLDEGISPDEEVSLAVDNVPAASVLDLLLENVAGVPLDWVSQNEVVTITTETISQERLETRLYPLSGILYEYPPGHRRKPVFGNFGFGFNTGGGAASRKRLGPPGGLSLVGPLTTGDEPAAEEDVFPWDSSDFDDGFGGSPGSAGENIDFDEVIDLIQNETSGPWFDLDGIGGSISEYPEALAIMVRQTKRAHDEIEELLRALRELPQANQSVRPARVPRITADQNADMDGLINLIENETSGPWFDLDGIGGTITEHFPSLSYFIRQTRRNHEEIYSLLAELRQARCVAEHYDETGELVEFAELGLIGPGITVTRLPALPPLDQLPPPTAEELALLDACRAEPVEGSRKWMHETADADAERFTVSQQDGRLEATLDGSVLRADGDRAAVAYPKLTLVEIGDWGEAFRQLLDARLPWMPHRSNAELARLFDVTRHAADDDGITLKLAFPTGGAYLLATFDRQTRRVVGCEAYRGGRLEYRLRFDEEHEAGGVTLEDAGGAVSERWAATDAAAVPVPALTEGWEGYLVDDPLEQLSPFRRARQALQMYDYNGAESILRDGLRLQPGQPLLSLMLAWMQEYLPYDELARFEQRQMLEQVVHAADAGLVEQVTALNFPSLSDRELYFLLLEQPLRRRTAANWSRLAELAQRQGRYPEALEHLQAALAATGDHDTVALREGNLNRIQLLLLLGRDPEANAGAEELLAQQGESTSILVKLGDLFGAAGHIATADGYFSRAWQRDGLSVARRQELLTQQAQWHAGAARWRLLLQAAELLPADDHRRQYLVGVVSEEMNALDADTAADLSHATAATDLEVSLRLRQAELTSSPEEAARIALSLFRAQQLPADRFEWMVARLIQAGRFDEAIDILETSLRAGERLNANLRRQLAAAYVALGRPQDGLRADSQVDEERKPPKPPPPPPNQGFSGSFFGGGFGGGASGFFSVEDAP